MHATAEARTGTVRIWGLLLRIFHWALVLSFAVAWLTADDLKDVHIWAGYTVAGLLVFRLAYGLAGPHYARFSQFVRGPSETLGYARDMVINRERRYLGHNPAGAMMVIALLACLSGIAATGYMQTTDAFWGISWVKETHEFLANGALALIGLHVAGVVLASYRHHENLVRSMVTGRKRAADPGDIA